ncbi:MAG: MBL fold metallo-hydrolase, partial [Nitrososphaera sp.]
ANTSLSVIYKGFHLLVDAGSGVQESVKKDAGMPDAILITSAKKQHTSGLASLAKGSTKVYCTAECGQQIAKELPSLAASFAHVSPGTAFEAGPFSVVPIAADNAGDKPGMPGSAIFVIKAGSRKVVAGWDFLKLINADDDLLWSPDLVVLGTETYNEHPSTGMISVSEAYDLVRRWNAKLCYILHYSGEKDREDAKNQWHRGPAGPLSPDELQKAVDDHLLVSGKEGKYAIKVAKEGMTWSPTDAIEEEGPPGRRIEVDALDRHTLSIEKTDDGKVALAIEDSINRMTLEFVNPKSGENSLHGDGIKSMMMKGPELDLVVSENAVRIDITKGKKAMFAGDLPVSEKDSKKIIRYIRENFQQAA